MIRQKLIRRIDALENTTGVWVEPMTIEVVFIDPDGTPSKTARTLMFTIRSDRKAPAGDSICPPLKRGRRA
jgi:hypothetical protein